MRTLSTTLTAAQQASSLEPKIKITLGASQYVYEQDRILFINPHTEEPYSQLAEGILDNSDGVLTNIDLKGLKAVISYGLKTSTGNEYSDSAPLWVMNQQLGSVPGKLICGLTMVGIPNLLAEDKANDSYIPVQEDEGWDWTIKTLLTKLLGATLACYNHCTGYAIVWGTLDDLIDSYKPKDSFRIFINSSRLAHIRRLLDLTKCVMIFKADGKAYIFKPTTTGSGYDYQYSLASGHTFFSKASRKTLVIPNRIVVKSNPDDDPKYEGSATDTESYALLPKTEYKQMRLESNSQANNIAAAALSKYQLWSELGAAEVPMNCGAEVFDYVKVTDERESDYRVGNIGTITRTYKPKQYSMRFSFGGWLSVRKLLDDLETYSQYDFLRLTVKDAYIENLSIDNIDAIWLDPESNIDLDKIGDTLDHLPDGELYARVKSLHLDAGQIKLDEYVYYKPGYDPNTKRRNFTAQPTTPYDLGDMWTDGTVLKRCTTARATGAYVASDWTQVSIDQIADGSVYHRVKSAALTAAGLVLLDQVIVGTYGLIKSAALTAAGLVLLDQVVIGTYGLVKSTDISAGHIVLSTCEGTLDDIDNGSIYGRVRSTDISAGHIKLVIDQNLSDQGIAIQTASSGSNRIKLDTDGLSFYYGAAKVGCFVHAGDGLVFQSQSGQDLLLYAGNSGVLKVRHCSADIVIYTDDPGYGIVPANDNRTILGRLTKRFLSISVVTGYFDSLSARVYAPSRIRIPVGTNAYDT